MEADEEQPEVPFGKGFVVHSAAHFGKPIVESPEQRKQNSPDDHVMKMRDYEIGGAELPVEWSRGEHDSRQARDQELEQERDTEKHGGFELNLTSPHRPDPIEDFDSSRDTDDHCGDHEEAVCIRTHPHGEHVVGPDAHAHESNAHRRRYHHRIPEDWLAGEYWNDFRNEGEGG